MTNNDKEPAREVYKRAFGSVSAAGFPNWHITTEKWMFIPAFEKLTRDEAFKKIYKRKRR